MDRRDNSGQNPYHKELEKEATENKYYDDRVTIDGKSYRIPYRMVKEVTFSNVRKEDLIDLEHAARLQYRLMLNDAVLRAKVEFVKQKITVVYNPETAENRKEKISLKELIALFAKEGVNLSRAGMEERDFDYFAEMYSYQFNPSVIREHPPYGYTAKEWERMRSEYNAKMMKSIDENRQKFEEWQKGYAEEHPEIFEGETAEQKEERLTFSERLFGKRKPRKGNGSGSI